MSLAGCSGGWAPVDSSSTAVSVVQQLPAPDVTTDAQDFTNYQIGPMDELVVDVFGAPDLKRDGQVDSAGNISLPLVGNISVGGKTPAEASHAIAEALRGKYLKDPQVTITIAKVNPRTVTVDGAVSQPGVYPVTGRMTLQEAIASARGAANVANLDNVVIFRTVNNQKMAALFSLRQIRSGHMNDPQIYGNDVVVVGEDAMRRFLRDFTIFPRFGSFVPFINAL
ncbi:MAG TPA: polysaccharide biosynthesis/export family protein [Sphingomicrobium sp.]|nr:polysaccharide biosynthesis/export family protein [Sphingomicrobium sp.]